MASGEFSRSFTSSRPRADCWTVLTDAVRVAGWVGIVHDVTIVEPLDRYEAVLASRIGPFNLKADLAVHVTEIIENERIRFEATGEDRQIGSRLAVTAGMHLTEDPVGTRVSFDGEYSVQGRAATLGSSTIKHKADTVLREFLDAAQKELA